jgi:hypothetical protein
MGTAKQVGGIIMPTVDNSPPPPSTIGQLSQQSEFAKALAQVPIRKNAHDYAGADAPPPKAGAKTG